MLFQFSLLIQFFAMCSVALSAQAPYIWPEPREVNSAQASALGLREIRGKHLHLWTDVPASPAVDELPEVFDAAVAEWAAYFAVPVQKTVDWQVQGFLIREREKFAALELLPAGHQDYLNGYALGNELWFDDQQGDYYRRHLLLHEGTHSFMLTFLGSGGPGWYMEGIAELLGTHRWAEHQLELNVLPASRDDFPLWGRIKLIRDAHAQGSAFSLGEVLAIDNRLVLTTEAYAWTWALSKFLDSHPDYKKQFRQLSRLVTRPDFNLRFRRLFRAEWADLNFAWEAFVATLDYGYDPQRMAIVHREIQPQLEPAPFLIAADRGWQAIPWLLREGTEYEVTSQGRFQIAHDGEPWPCEPGGVTIRYHDGMPLGMLIGVLRPRQPQLTSQASQEVRLLAPQEIGLRTKLKPPVDSVLYVRVNDSPAELSDNQGTLKLRIEPTKTAD